MAASKQPGPLGGGAQVPNIQDGTTPLSQGTSPQPVGTAPAAPTVDGDTKVLAATAYGEASVQDVFEEMAAIANVLVRQQTARGVATVGAFIRQNKTYAFAAHNGTPRYAKLMTATDADIAADPGMASAVRAARNALAPGGTDYSNGAYFWDGADIPTNGNHPKRLAGIHITDPKHDICGLHDMPVPGQSWWYDAHGRQSKPRGSWTYKYDSTAA